MSRQAICCGTCSNKFLAVYEEGMECPNCGVQDCSIADSLVLAQFTVNDKSVSVDFPSEIAVGVVEDFYVGVGRAGFTVMIAGETHSWPWGTLFKRMGVSE